MKRPLLAALLMAVALTGCGNSRLNPLNWFGSSKKVEVKANVDPVTGIPLPKADPRGMVADVTSMSVEPAQDGAILRATGLPPTQGWWNASLVPENDGKPVKGVLTYRFVIVPPPGPTPTSTPQSREVTVAQHLSPYQLAGVRQITVLGSRNARTAHR